MPPEYNDIISVFKHSDHVYLACGRLMMMDLQSFSHRRGKYILLRE